MTFIFVTTANHVVPLFQWCVEVEVTESTIDFSIDRVFQVI